MYLVTHAPSVSHYFMLFISSAVLWIASLLEWVTVHKTRHTRTEVWHTYSNSTRSHLHDFISFYFIVLYCQVYPLLWDITWQHRLLHFLTTAVKCVIQMVYVYSDLTARDLKEIILYTAFSLNMIKDAVIPILLPFKWRLIQCDSYVTISVLLSWVTCKIRNARCKNWYVTVKVCKFEAWML